MKFKILVQNTGGSDPWWEEHEEDTNDPREWAKDIIDKFNDTLKPREKARELLEVQITEGSNDALHNWDKDIKAMSAIFRGQMYDGMYCTKCNITGKRFGLDSHVTVDSKFKKNQLSALNLFCVLHSSFSSNYSYRSFHRILRQVIMRHPPTLTAIDQLRRYRPLLYSFFNSCNCSRYSVFR